MSAWALQIAVRDALGANAGLVALMGSPVRVFDVVPAGAQRPYIAFAEWRTDEDGSDDTRLDRHSFSLRISSDHQGAKEAKAIAAQIESALHNAALSLSSGTLVDLALVGSAFGRDEGDSLSFGEVRFRALTQG